MRWVQRCLLFLLAVTTTSGAQAAGFMISEIGPKAIGRGGAMVVNPDDPTALWLNPAGLSSVSGAQVYIDGSWVKLNSTFVRSCRPSCAPTAYEKRYGSDTVTVSRHPDEELREVDGERVGGFWSGDVNDKRDLILGKDGDSVGVAQNRSPGRLIPFAALAINGELIGIPGLGLGFGAYGPNTGGVLYDRNGPQRYSVIESLPLEAIFEAAISYRFNRYLGFGLGLAFESIGTEQEVAISMDKDGRETRERDVDLRLNLREDFIPTFMVGFTSNPVAGLHIGGSFQPTRYARATGPVRLNAVNDQSWDLPLTFDGSNARGVGYFTTPAIARMGISYVFDKWFDVEVAAVREFWSSYTHVRLDVQDLVIKSDLPVASGLPPTIQPKDYRDTWSLRAGGDFNILPGVLTVRAGAFAEESAIPEHTLDVSVADSNKFGLSTGVSIGYFGFKLTGAYQHIFMEPRVVDQTQAVSQNPLAAYPIVGTPGNTAVALGRYDMSYDIFSVGITMDVGEVATRVKGAVQGDKGWWKPQGVQDRTVVNAASWLQEQSNLD
ncbi:MAG: outer membrane protein transport protein [Myxococcota bacterium]